LGVHVRPAADILIRSEEQKLLQPTVSE